MHYVSKIDVKNAKQIQILKKKILLQNPVLYVSHIDSVLGIRLLYLEGDKGTIPF